MKNSTPQLAATNLRAIWAGAAVDVAGSLVMTTVIGVTAIAAMLYRGVPAQTIAEQLPKSFALAAFCAAAGVIMSVAGGYVAAAKAARSHLRHAILAGLLATLMNIGVVVLFGESGPLWLTALATALILPLAAIGGWLATPIVKADR